MPASLCARHPEAHEVFRVVREVAVHFEDVVVPTLEGEAEPSEVGRAQTELALAFDEVDAFAVYWPALV